MAIKYRRYVFGHLFHTLNDSALSHGPVRSWLIASILMTAIHFFAQ
jgi:hypothetical protein